MKDPAILFYTSDFLTGCLDLDMEERGQYITLLCLQHQKGHLSEKTIRLSLGNVSDFVMKKFKKDNEGLFYNERMDDEINKRLGFTNSRRLNGKKGGRPKKDNKPNGKASVKPLGLASENLIENENRNESIYDIEKISEENYLKKVHKTLSNQFYDITFDELKIQAENFVNEKIAIQDINEPFREYAMHFINKIKSSLDKNKKEQFKETKTKRYKCWALNNTRFYNVDTEEEAKQGFYNDYGVYPTKITLQ